MLTDRQVWALSTIRIICGCISVVFSLLFFSVIIIKTLLTTKKGVQLRHKIAQIFSRDQAKLKLQQKHSNLQSEVTATPATPGDVITSATATATSPYDDSHLRHKSGYLKKPYFFRFLSVRLVCFLQFCSMMSAVADLYGYETMYKGGDEAMCIVQGIQTQFFRIATAWWSLSISIWLIYSIVFAKKYEMWVEALSHFFSWIAAIVCTLLPLIGRTYGKTFPQFGWCWINRNTTLGIVWTMTTYFGVLWTIFGIILISYAILLRKIIVVMRTSSSVLSTRTHVNKIQFLAIAKLSIIPALFLLILVFPSVNIIYELAAKDENFWLLLLNTVSFPLHGFLNALLFMLNPSFLYECFSSMKRNLRGMKKQPKSPVVQTPAAGGATTHISTLSAASLDESAEEIEVPIDHDIKDIPAASQTINNCEVSV